MAKKRQLNVRLPDALLSQLEDRVLKTKMGMAAMVEVLLVQALQMQEVSENTAPPEDHVDSLVKRIEALEAKVFAQANTSTQTEIPTLEESSSTTMSVANIAPDIEKHQTNDLEALKGESLATRLNVEVRILNQKKDKSTFSNWAKKHDLEGIAWKYVASEDCFYPIAN
ncbi:MAG: hypothetical protein DCF19_20450 [Pseudanabaena frigida]|uniref:Uncharacterized protein n=1 Tax=Pseudanabaena frigida TaxID=945775 RepID=A0A2W4VWH3_9CYAN|nr:MAG: hypothetical protein DCF19_20450 [Pseudanabaena frigida]